MKKTLLVIFYTVLVMCSCTLPNNTEEVTYYEDTPISQEYLVIEGQQENKEIQANSITNELEISNIFTEDEEISTPSLLYEDINLYTDVSLSVSQIENVDETIFNLEEKKDSDKNKEQAISNLVTVSIVALNETIFDTTLIELQDNQTAFDILSKVTKENKIHMDYSGRGGTVYIRGINNIYEHDMGAESGWMYRVNGEFPNTSSGSYVLQPGDVIEWLYTLNLGKDMGNSLD